MQTAPRRSVQGGRGLRPQEIMQGADDGVGLVGHHIGPTRCLIAFKGDARRPGQPRDRSFRQVRGQPVGARYHQQSLADTGESRRVQASRRAQHEAADAVGMGGDQPDDVGRHLRGDMRAPKAQMVPQRQQPVRQWNVRLVCHRLSPFPRLASARDHAWRNLSAWARRTIIPTNVTMPDARFVGGPRPKSRWGAWTPSMPLCRSVARVGAERPPGLGNAMVREIGTFCRERLIAGKSNNIPRVPRLIVTIPPAIRA